MSLRTLADFEGRWRILREIDDRRAGQVGQFEGTATLTVDAQGLIYAETGTLRIGTSAPMQADRTYLWRDEGGRIAVLFDDGRPFHSFALATDTPGADHWCDPDTYRVTYDFSPWPNWSAEWAVTGPRKDYVMVSYYAPAA